MTSSCDERDRAAESRPVGIGGVSLVFMVSVMIGLALSPTNLLGGEAGGARQDRGTPPRQVEQIRCIAETIVRIATKAARTDRYMPVGGAVRTEASGSGNEVCVGSGEAAQVVRVDVFVREALLGLPPPWSVTA